MLFNSLVFAAFLPLVFALYWWVVKSVQARNLLLITAGFVFYGWWDWRFLFLLLATSMTDYVVALAMGRTTDARRRKVLLALSLIGNLGTLGTFKYYDFFARSLAEAMATVGVTCDPLLLNVILPVGISFYTFQALSYTIDVYRKRIEPVRDLGAYMAFISFFPQLCAGPIERASNMLPQFSRQRVFDATLAADGLRQMLWGFFKKIVIADNCSRLVKEIFDRSDHLPGPVLMLGAVLFAFQIYCDFGGYSDIAIGCARLFGFQLMRNFAFPYFSRDIAEFWRRWHISLSTWFRDYLYIPLGGSRGGISARVRNTLIIFTVSGFWHGANWTFLIWGALNGLYFLPLLLRGKNRANLDIAAAGRWLPDLREAAGMITTFTLTCVAWVFFRAEDLAQAVRYFNGIAHRTFATPAWNGTRTFLGNSVEYAPAGICLALLVAVEWIQRSRHHGLERLPGNRAVRWSIYLALIGIILFVGDHGEQQFIYFQF